jgi:ABC-type Na+ efflux pump permease subunit
VVLANAWLVCRKDTAHIVRGREMLLWVFVMPIVFFYFIGTVTGGFSVGRGGAKDPIGVRIPGDGGFLADSLVRRLEAEGFEVVKPDSDDELAAASRRLILPAEFTASALEGRRAVVRFERREAGLGQHYDRFRIARAVYGTLADLAAVAAAADAPDAEAIERMRTLPRSVAIEAAPAGKRKVIPTGFEQAVPGIMVMFTLIALLTGGAATLVVERRQGLLRRLASTPLGRGEIVLGKWAGRLGLGFVQIGFGMLAGTVLFGMRWGPDLPMVLVVLLGWGALCASLGLLLGNLARTEGQAVGVGVLASNVLAALGGCWWPIEITPSWMQALARTLPTGWAMDALHRLVSFEAGPASALLHVGALFAAALVLGALAVRTFRFD